MNVKPFVWNPFVVTFILESATECSSVPSLSCPTILWQELNFKFIRSAKHDSFPFHLCSSRSGSKQLFDRTYFICGCMDRYSLWAFDWGTASCSSSPLRGQQALSWLVSCYYFGSFPVNYCSLFSIYKNYSFVIFELPSATVHQAEDSKTMFFALISSLCWKQIAHSLSCTAVENYHRMHVIDDWMLASTHLYTTPWILVSYTSSTYLSKLAMGDCFSYHLNLPCLQYHPSIAPVPKWN